LRTALFVWLATGAILGLIVMPVVERAMAVRHAKESSRLKDASRLHEIIADRDALVSWRNDCGLSEKLRLLDRAMREDESVRRQLESTHAQAGRR
jgi:hypothetical protein